MNVMQKILIIQGKMTNNPYQLLPTPHGVDRHLKQRKEIKKYPYKKNQPDKDRLI
jgi:hypothetical protein